ncbi:MAG: hypothetical protein RR066_05025 [Mucinivorans sp.]
METFFTVLLIIFVGSWLFGQLLKFLLKVWLLRKQREFSGHMGGNFASGSRGGSAWGGASASKREQGEVRVEQKPEQDHTVNKEIGQYVDFEEEKLN